MKRLLVLILILAGILAYAHGSFIFSTMSYGGGYTVYNGKIDEEYNLNAWETLAKTLIDGDKGKCVRFTGDGNDVDEILKKLNVKVVYTQELANVVIIYGYSPKLGEGVKVNGERANIQIARRGATVTVGTPLINGSY